eukprot:CAMPEP_0176355788 /NCGR_PEP_ID=MMETSP0126-20121128/13544_1 /TAXON_ID=141414 ORGANISM="Strombidinopsis acuminatum, Strain SPMC142" /NCGR_SAMPLE_ID=MMETSP0126 /ASSEMBLY_ACC=CAM_ASM_000229 /LENGTH=69 /DNA_ID=CAMNT_0017708587 /DNA_START=999 /DNA_END=1208 /DNA_ORIENTATION=+
MAKYADEKVDAMRKQKDEELEHYKKEIERAKRFESKQAAAANQGSTIDTKNIKIKNPSGGARPLQRRVK